MMIPYASFIFGAKPFRTALSSTRRIVSPDGFEITADATTSHSGVSLTR